MTITADPKDSFVLTLSRDDRHDYVEALSVALDLCENNMNEHAARVRKDDIKGVPQNDPGYRLNVSNLSHAICMRDRISKLLNLVQRSSRY